MTDAEALAALWREAGEHLVGLDPDVFQVPASAGMVDFFRGLLTRSGEDVIRLVAVAGQEIVGTTQAHVEHPVDSAPYQVQRHLGQVRLVVDLLSVAESARRCGVGRSLMNEVEAWGRSRSAACVLLDTFAASP